MRYSRYTIQLGEHVVDVDQETYVRIKLLSAAHLLEMAVNTLGQYYAAEFVNAANIALSAARFALFPDEPLQ